MSMECLSAPVKTILAYSDIAISWIESVNWGPGLLFIHIKSVAIQTSNISFSSICTVHNSFSWSCMLSLGERWHLSPFRMMNGDRMTGRWGAVFSPGEAIHLWRTLLKVLSITYIDICTLTVRYQVLCVCVSVCERVYVSIQPCLTWCRWRGYKSLGCC